MHQGTNLVNTFLRSELNHAVTCKFPGPDGCQHSPSGCIQISTDQNVHLIWFNNSALKGALFNEELADHQISQWQPKAKGQVRCKSEVSGPSGHAYWCSSLLQISAGQESSSKQRTQRGHHSRISLHTINEQENSRCQKPVVVHIARWLYAERHSPLEE